MTNLSIEEMIFFRYLMITGTDKNKAIYSIWDIRICHFCMLTYPEPFSVDGNCYTGGWSSCT